MVAACQATPVATQSPQSSTDIPTPIQTSPLTPTSAGSPPPTLPATPGSPEATPATTPEATPEPTTAPTSTPAATPIPTSQATSAATASPAAESDGLVIEWRQERDEPAFGNPLDNSETRSFHSATKFGGQFFVAGANEDDDFNIDHSLWSSTNGTAWELVDPQVQGEVYSMAANQSALLMTGASGLWLTTNGASWEPVTFTDLENQGIQWVGATSEGFVGFGTGAWISADGRSWQPLMTDSALALLAAGVVEFASYGDQIVAIAGTGSLEAWTSTNLTDWTRAGAFRRTRNAYDQSLAAGPLGWILAGYEEGRTHRDFMWTSANGLDWQEVSEPVGPVSDVFVDDLGFVAVGFRHIGQGCALDPSDIQGYTWTSLDGHTWTEMQREDFERGRIDQLLPDGRSLIGIGVRYDEEEYLPYGSIWSTALPPIPPTADGPQAPALEPIPTGCGP